MNIDIKKPIKLSWVSNTTWDLLSLKEKDFVIYLHKWVTKSFIMRRLHISGNSWLWRLQKRVTNKLIKDIDKINKKRRKTFK